jgi:hypothetical protein
MKSLTKAALFVATAFAAGTAAAAVTVIADSALQATNTLYTNSFGDIVVMTGGGNAAGVGDATGRNDDGFSGPINLGYTLTNFFGNNYSQFWVNNNGNITFNGGVSAYTPTGPQGTTQPVIAPFFADVDTRGAGSGVVRLNQSAANETVVTWDRVGYYGAHDDKLNTFQLVLRGPNYSIPAGQGQIGFFWTTMQWETGDASGGNQGFGGTPAAVGFGDGNANGFVLESSLKQGISSVVDHKYIWFNLSQAGTPVPVPAIPEPETYALMLAGLAAVAWVARRRSRRG